MDDANEIKEVDIPTNVKRRWFTDVKDSKLIEQLRMTYYSMYATSLADHTQYMLENIERYFPNLSKLSITDGTACIGGNARMFVGVFNRVNLVDISKIHMDILLHNFRVLGLSNRSDVNIVMGNYLNVATQLSQDIIFLDPPWGGVNYYTKKNGALYFLDDNGEKVLIHKWINTVLYKCAKMIVLKVPKYYSTRAFIDMSKFKCVEVIHVMKDNTRISYKMVIMSHVMPNSRIISKHRLLSTVDYRSILKVIKNKSL